MSKKTTGIFALLQKVGKSLMLPVSVLPAAGLMVALSRVIEQLAGEQFLAGSPLLDTFVQILFSGGLVVFENLPLIFAVGVAIGFTAGEAVSGLASLVGYVVLTKVLEVISTVQNLEDPINMGVFGGIIIGLVSAKVYKKYFKTQLHPVLGFFAGKRLVPIMMVIYSILLGIAFGFIWPPIQNGINALGQMAIDAQIGGFRLGGAIYAFGNRALIPTGLHHVFKTPFTIQFGQYIHPETGEIFVGEIARFFAGDPTAGAITAAEYPLKIFGLPAAALAIYMTSLKKNKKAIGGVMLTAALTSIITGITEPIEFAFMFVAPVLYLAHISLAFVGGLLMNAAGVRLTETFTSSLIDYVVSISTGNAGNPFMLIPIGIVIGVLYFVTFYFLIRKFDLKTPGRDENEKEQAEYSISQKAVEVLSALGGRENIKHIDACITRLRLELNEPSRINKQKLKELGSAGVMEAGGGSVQVIFGTQAETLKDEIKVVMENPDQVTIQTSQTSGAGKENESDDVQKSQSVDLKMETILKSPVKGKKIDLKDVPDALFAGKMIGDGFAVDPESNRICSPVNGEIVHIFETNHAVGLVTAEGLEVLVHIGIDTVKLKGEGFTRIASIGQKVKAGDLLIECDLDYLRDHAKSMITPVVITNMEKVKSLEWIGRDEVEEGNDVLIIKH